MVYDVIVIGAGAAGLFAGASVPSRVRGLIIERGPSAGKKLLLSGSGQCNLTHGGDIRDFVPRYGRNGSRIRSILYRFNNREVTDFFAARGVPLLEREDGKVFPESFRAADVLAALVAACSENGFSFSYNRLVDGIAPGSDPEGPLFTVSSGAETFSARKLVVASGGSSYPATGSDGSLFPVLEKLGIAVVPPKPALVPLLVKDYPYGGLAGISFPAASVALRAPSGAAGSKGAVAENSGDLLLTHGFFSGPAILDLSRYASAGDTLSIDFVPSLREDEILRDLKALAPGNRKQFATILSDYLNGGPELSGDAAASVRATPARIPKRFLEAICARCGVDAAVKLPQLSLSALRSVVAALKRDSYTVTGTNGFRTAMATAGGVSLDEIDPRTLASCRYPGLHFAGEALDVDGDTGGYNLQFAFSSGHLAGSSI